MLAYSGQAMVTMITDLDLGVAAVSLTCSNRLVDVRRPDWWDYPLECLDGHVWRPGAVSVSWVPCNCQGDLGHLRVSCRTDGCTSPAWYRPRHTEGAEVTGRPGAADMQPPRQP